MSQKYAYRFRPAPTILPSEAKRGRACVFRPYNPYRSFRGYALINFRDSLLFKRPCTESCAQHLKHFEPATPDDGESARLQKVSQARRLNTRHIRRDDQRKRWSPRGARPHELDPGFFYTILNIGGNLTIVLELCWNASRHAPKPTESTTSEPPALLGFCWLRLVPVTVVFALITQWSTGGKGRW